MTTRSSLVNVLLAAAVSAACGRQPGPATAESHSLNVTDWTDKTELYMEYPPLVAGHPVRFAVHLTKLSDFQALTAGTPSIEFTPESGDAKTLLRALGMPFRA